MAQIKRLLFGSTRIGRFLRILTLLTIFAYPFGYHYRPVYIDGISMEPTYDDGQWSLVQRRRSLGGSWIPDRFDAVTVWSDKHNCTLCKRVLGLPGETIEVKEGTIFINGKEMKDTFGIGKMIRQKLEDPVTGKIWLEIYDNIEPQVIPANHVWIVGDNRADSVFGDFPINKIQGKIILY